MASLGQISINNILIHEIESDPRVGDGVNSDVGDIAIATDGSGIFQKIGPGNNQWAPLALPVIANNQHTANSNANDLVLAVTAGLNRILHSINGQTSLQVGSQSVGIGFGTNDINQSSLLELRSTSRGLLMPRMTTSQRNAISSPAIGLEVFDTSINAKCVYTPAGWTYSFSRVLGAASSTTSTTYSNIDPEFVVSLEAGRYLIYFSGLFSSALSTNGIGIRLANGTATINPISIDWAFTQTGNGTGKNFMYGQTSAADNVVSPSVPTAGVFYPASGSGFFVKNDGTIALQFRSEVSGIAVTIGAGAILKIERVGN